MLLLVTSLTAQTSTPFETKHTWSVAKSASGKVKLIQE
jgi:hypothetical protein